ncbi:protein of unknown function [Legionella hackeliae]|uniref:Uncharacterized protein n=1 Tax=Legionella hackeliae TaxID=449 RepID=A0A0A8UU30_LEGHA|nr:hypothetical protein Lhac_3069 [Legionella hackeliae]CEK10274.1 protein of unknown function [Legionella hackeliae]
MQEMEIKEIIYIFPIVTNYFFVIMAACAGVAELVDAPDSKSGGGDTVWVRVPPSVPLIVHKRYMHLHIKDFSFKQQLNFKITPTSLSIHPNLVALMIAR